MNIIKSFMLLVVLLSGGCKSNEQTLSHLNFYIESWDRISVRDPYAGTGFISKSEATKIIREKKNAHSKEATVMLGKNIHVSEKTLQEDMDTIQAWLLGEGFQTITFRLATSDIDSPIVRIYHDGKITTPNQLLVPTRTTPVLKAEFDSQAGQD